MSSLYIHIPFCQKKCLYCSFAVAVSQEQHIETYLDCLDLEAARYEGEEIESVHLGGGTPSFMRSEQLQRLARMIRNRFVVSSNAEIAIEINPEDVFPEKADALFGLGFNRISLGGQSFQDRYLKMLGRCHDAEKIYHANTCFRAAGFANVNIDLMYGFPGQTQEEILNDLHEAVRLDAEHVSLYALTIEPNSRFFAQHVDLQSPQVQGEHYVRVTEFLSNHYEQYEISNFSKPGRESRHNLNYWLGGDYIGLGMAAHSHRQGKRSWNVSRLHEYIRRIRSGADAIEGGEQLDDLKRLKEAFLFGLRMNRGVNLQSLEETYDVRMPGPERDKLEQFIGGGFLYLEKNGHLKATMKGQVVLDEISSYLI